jgi:hypothetical protein
MERYPPVPVYHWDSIVYRQQVIYRALPVIIKLPPDTVSITADIDSLLNPLMVENKNSKAIAKVYKNRLRLILIQKSTEIKTVLDSASKETTYWREKYQTDKQMVIKEVRFIPWYCKFFTPFGIVALILLVLYITLKVIRK